MLSFLKKAFEWVMGTRRKVQNLESAVTNLLGYLGLDAERIKAMHDQYLLRPPHEDAVREWVEMRNAVNNLATRLAEIEKQLLDLHDNKSLSQAYKRLTDGGAQQ